MGIGELVKNFPLGMVVKCLHNYQLLHCKSQINL